MNGRTVCGTEDNAEFLLRLENGLMETKCQCFAWVLMGNHFHLLIRIGDGSLSKLMRSLLTGYADVLTENST